MTDTAAEPQPFSDFLINYPLFDQAVGRELAELAADVQAADRKGSMVIKVEVEKVGRTDDRRLIVKVANEVKPPKGDPDIQMFFPGARGLSKDDPQQVRVDWETGEVIVPDAPTSPKE